MVKIINAFSGQDPLAQKLSELGKSFFGDELSGALRREQLNKLQRENVETQNFGQEFSQNGLTPVAERLLILSGYKPQDAAIITRMKAANSSEFDPVTRGQLGAGEAMGNTVSGFGQTLAETQRNNNMGSADRRYGVDVGATTMRRGQDINSVDDRYRTDTSASTARRGQDIGSADSRYGVDQRVGLDREQFNLKPMPAYDPNTKLPTFTTQAGAATSGLQPILSNTEQQGTMVRGNPTLQGLTPQTETYLGADPTTRTQTPKNYVLNGQNFITYDGKTNAQTGAPLPPGGALSVLTGGAADVGLPTAVTTGAIGTVAAGERFKYLADRARVIAQQDPTAFGLLGQAQGLSYSAIAFLNNVGELAGGKDFASGVKVVEDKVLANPAVDKNLFIGKFNPNVPKLQSVAAMISYVGAEAIASQKGKEVSNTDIAMIQKIVGDPTSIFSNAEDFLARLAEAQAYVEQQSAQSTRLLQQGPASLTGPAPASVPPSAGQQGPVQTAPPPVVERWDYGPDGVLRRVQ